MVFPAARSWSTARASLGGICPNFVVSWTSWYLVLCSRLCGHYTELPS